MPFATLPTDWTPAELSSTAQHAANHVAVHTAINELKALVADIRDHGAATATADNATAIQAAIAAGGIVTIPQQTFGSGTLTAASGTRIMGLGPTSVLQAKTNLNGTLISIPDGTTDVTISGVKLAGNSANQSSSGTLIAIGNNCRRITIEADVLLSDPKSHTITVGTGCKDIRLGPQKRVLFADWFGCDPTALFFEAASITNGSRTVTVTDGGLTADMAGRTFEIVSGGSPDSNGGYQNWRGTVATVDTTAQTFTASADPPPNNRTTTGLRGSVAVDILPRKADMEAAAAAIGALAMRYPAGNYWSSIQLLPKAGQSVIGEGPGLTRIRAGRQAPTIQVINTSDVVLKGMTLEGAGPDGGSTGTANATAVLDVNASKRLWMSELRVRYGAVGVAIHEQGTEDIFPRDVLVEDITGSNGTSLVISGIGWWVFSAVKRLHASGITARNIARHGWHFDAGTTSLTGSTQHGYPQDCKVDDLTLENVCSTIGGGALIFGGALRCTVGMLTVNGTGPGGDGIAFTADQNGEFSQHCSVGVASLKGISGNPLQFASSRDCSVGMFELEDFNVDQNAANTNAITFAGYTNVNDGVNNGAAAKSGVAAQDTLNNYVGLAQIRYAVDLTLYRGNGGSIAAGVADPTLYANAVVFQGGQTGPDATATAGSLRWMRTQGNRVAAIQTTAPNGGYASYSSTAVTVAGCAVTSGSPTLTRTRGSTFVPFLAADLPAGTPISGAGIPTGTTVSAVVDPDTLTLSQVATGNQSGMTATITLSAPLFNPSAGPLSNFVHSKLVSKVLGTIVLQSAVVGDAANRFEVTNDGKLRWGDGTNTPDAILSRIAAAALQLQGALSTTGALSSLVGLGVGNATTQVQLTNARRATATWNPPSVADGATYSETFSDDGAGGSTVIGAGQLTGAQTTDMVLVSHTNLVATDALLTGKVTAGNKVTVTLLNKTGGALDVASGTLTILVLRSSG